MTVQASDYFFYNGEDADIILSTDRLSFDPREFGIKTKWTRTCNYRGFIATYKIVGNELWFSKLSINIQGETAPEIYGTKPFIEEIYRDRQYGFYSEMLEAKAEKNPSVTVIKALYENINHRVDYNGRLQIGFGRTNDYWFSCNYWEACIQGMWAYKKVLELHIENGIVKETIDKSNVAESLRNSEEFMSQVERQRIIDIEDGEIELPKFLITQFEDTPPEREEGK